MTTTGSLASTIVNPPVTVGPIVFTRGIYNRDPYVEVAVPDVEANLSGYNVTFVDHAFDRIY